jgi:riboflavin synthase alpha subunit
MFTGLVRELGTLRAVSRRGGNTLLEIHAPLTAARLAVGASLAVNGICLTVTRRRGALVAVTAAAETRRVTTLPRWRAGDRLHLEPALRAADTLDGHLVLGHVDGVGRVVGYRRSGGSVFMGVAPPSELMRFLMPKGSVAVDGVSLTMDAGPFRDRFTVNLIPHTLVATNFARVRVGQAVNLEMDVLVKAARSGTRPAASYEPDARTPSTTAGSSHEGAAGGTTLADLLARGWRRR